MIKNKYLIIAALVLIFPFTIAWTFNHINPWVAVGLVALGMIVTNQYFQNKNK